MATGAVWGIDIGQCALKALRCRVHENPKKLTAEAFDYIEYPKILSQSGSDPTELISDALKQFLSRNSVLGDRVAVSVSGQAGLARFIKLPPVESKKIPDIVRYEAKQQIPFDLNDVVWDYQRMGVGSVEEGFALETEIGLFAMKRDAVMRALDPFLKLDIEVHVVQLTPLVLYNFLLFDQLDELPPADEYDPENPPESVAIISMGTDATDLVITNGYRVWQRSIPLGGSHFTKALIRELKLTFAKAEHLKRNATAATDPKAVFQAMRPVFSDLLTELQRSIGYFSNLDRAAKIGRVVALGNAMKLPGLRRYLSQSLGYEIEKIESYRGLVGPQVVTAPAFQENVLSFPVCYGLVLQGLGKSGVHTNLLPKEIIQDRLIKRKKPWAVAAAAVLLLGITINYLAYCLAQGTVEKKGVWEQPEQQADQLAARAGSLTGEKDQALNALKAADEIGKNLVGNVEGRIRWLELLKAINQSLPPYAPVKEEDPKVPIANRISEREQLHVTNLDCQQVEDVSQWYSALPEDVKKSCWPVAADTPPAAGPTPPGGPTPVAGPIPATGPTPPAGAIPAANPAADNPADAASGPKGPGWIVRICGYHYHNADRTNYGAEYVRNTLIKQLRDGEVTLPTRGGQEKVKLKDLGITCPVLINPSKPYLEQITDPNAEPENAPGGMGHPGLEPGLGGMPRNRPAGAGAGDLTGANNIDLQRFDFVVHFCWQPKTPSERHNAQKTPEKTQTAAQP